ncbi:MAG: four helix bundle protein [Bacteroidetes bacterium]|nr:four helix bundle protein [Bacteroidota bacterium]
MPMDEERAAKNLIVELTLEFSYLIMDYCDQLEAARKYNLANPLFRSGTAIGALVREAQNSESKADFIHKLKIAAKEGDETEHWLLLARKVKNAPPAEILFEKLKSINRILNRIIATSKSGT